MSTVVFDIEADVLEQAIPILDSLYEVGDPCILPDDMVTSLSQFKTCKGICNPISDPLYDAMRTRLKKLRPDSDIFEDTTASKVDLQSQASKKIQHNPPMTSIAKADGTITAKNAILKKWLEENMSKLGYKSDMINGEPAFAQSFKRDGVSCRLYYEDGRLVHAGVRPRDGINAADIIEHVKYVKGVPFNLPEKLTCIIAGELEILIPEFEVINKDRATKGEKLLANPRNACAGAMNPLGDPENVKHRRVSFMGHSIIMDNPPYKTAIQRAKWANQKLKVLFVRVEAFNYASLQKMEDLVPDLEYEVDGIVIEVNNLDDSEQRGNSGDTPTGDPRGKIAWKFLEQKAKPTIKNIRWQPGRFKITPVAEFDGVRLAGTTVTNCTCHNVAHVINDGLGVGAVIQIYKAGKIIPYMEAVLNRSTNVSYPDSCPACKAKTEIVGEELLCTNDLCPAKHIAAMVHYLATFGVKGVGESIVTGLAFGGLVKTYADFYKIIPEQIEKAGYSEREAVLIYARIHMIDGSDKIKDNARLRVLADKAASQKHPIQIGQLIAALGIPGASKGTGRDLAAHFRDFDKIRKASVADLEQTANIGTATSEGLHEFFSKRSIEIDQLLSHIEPEKPRSGKFNNLNFVFTGGMSKERGMLEKMVEDEGGKVSSSVSKKTNYVVVGTSPGSKADKANQLGIKTINEREFEEMLGIKSDLPEDTREF